MTTDPDLFRRCERCDEQLPDDAHQIACVSCDVDVFVCTKCRLQPVAVYVCEFCSRRSSLDEPTDDVDLGYEAYDFDAAEMMSDTGGEA